MQSGIQNSIETTSQGENETGTRQVFCRVAQVAAKRHTTTKGKFHPRQKASIVQGSKIDLPTKVSQRQRGNTLKKCSHFNILVITVKTKLQSLPESITRMNISEEEEDVCMTGLRPTYGMLSFSFKFSQVLWARLDIILLFKFSFKTMTKGKAHPFLSLVSSSETKMRRLRIFHKY